MSKTKYLIDNQEKEISNGHSSIEWIDNTYFTIFYMGKKFHGEIIEENIEDQKLTVKINHRVFNIKRERAIDALVRELGLDKKRIRKLHQLKSPMPGRILSFQVNVGDEVQEGTPLFTLEAMKMENIIKAEGVGKVKAIIKEKETVVDKDELVIEFE